MSSIKDKIRLTVLGSELYKKCKAGGVTEKELKDRIDFLHKNKLYAIRNVQQLTEVCNLLKRNVDSVELVGEDVFKYIILPNLTFEEINNYALASKSNLQLVENYFKTIYVVPLSLLIVNNSTYFVDIALPTYDVLYKTYRAYKSYKNKTDQQIHDIAKAKIERDMNEKVESHFILACISKLFTLLQAHFVYSFITPETQELQERKITMIDYSNLSLFNKSFSADNLKNEKSIKIEKSDKLTLKVFMKKNYNQELFSGLKTLTKLISETNNEYTNSNISDLYVDRKKFGNLTLGVVFTFNFDLDRFNMYDAKTGFYNFFNFFPKKKGISTLDF